MAMSPPGRTVGCDFAGTIEDPNGSKWKQGQRVAGWVHGASAKPPRGAFAEYLVVESSLVFAIPDTASFQDAAVIPLAFATAVQGLFQRLALPEPSSPTIPSIPILINGGTSSVGKYAIQLAKLAGLFVISTGSQRNHSLLKDLGADIVIDYNDADWPAQVNEHDVQHALDCISEPATTQSVAEALSPIKGGHIVCILPRKTEELQPAGKYSNVRVESTLGYTVFGRAFPRAPFDNCDAASAIADKLYWEKWLTLLPEYLESGRIKPNRVKELGGLDDVLKGFELHAQGKLSAEKIVYKIV